MMESKDVNNQQTSPPSDFKSETELHEEVASNGDGAPAILDSEVEKR
jgi:hypothetical protein